MSSVATETLTPKSLGGLRIATVRERPPHINALFYGAPGVGKTVLCGSADDVPEMRKVLVLDFEGGTFSLRNTHPNVDTIRITEWTQLQPIYQELERGGHGYETVVIDSASEAQKFSMLWIMKKVVENDSSRDIEVPSMREWGKNLEQMRRMVRGFRDLPMNCIFTAHATEEKDTKRGLILKSPSFSGKLKAEIAGFLDIVGFMYTKEVKGRDEPARLLLTGSTEDIVAKDRSGRLPLVLENPTMTQLYKTITDD